MVILDCISRASPICALAAVLMLCGESFSRSQDSLLVIHSEGRIHSGTVNIQLTMHMLSSWDGVKVEWDQPRCRTINVGDVRVNGVPCFTREWQSDGDSPDWAGVPALPVVIWSVVDAQGGATLLWPHPSLAATDDTLSITLRASLHQPLQYTSYVFELAIQRIWSDEWQARTNTPTFARVTVVP